MSSLELGLWWAKRPAPGSTGEGSGRDSRWVGFVLTLPAASAMVVQQGGGHGC